MSEQQQVDSTKPKRTPSEKRADKRFKYGEETRYFMNGKKSQIQASTLAKMSRASQEVHDQHEVDGMHARDHRSVRRLSILWTEFRHVPEPTPEAVWEEKWAGKHIVYFFNGKRSTELAHPESQEHASLHGEIAFRHTRRVSVLGTEFRHVQEPEPTEVLERARNADREDKNLQRKLTIVKKQKMRTEKKVAKWNEESAAAEAETGGNRA